MGDFLTAVVLMGLVILLLNWPQIFFRDPETQEAIGISFWLVITVLLVIVVLVGIVVAALRAMS
jgi:hypothetical protein